MNDEWGGDEWRPVVGYEGLYEISNLGQLRSMDRWVVRSDGVRRWLTGRILRPYVDKKGRLWYPLTRHGKSKKIAHLVLEAFVGPRPEGMVCCHWDDDPGNNRVTNLRWDTQGNNLRDKARNGRHELARRTHCKNGHPFSGTNLHIGTRGQRICRTCRRQWWHDWKARQIA